MPQRLQRRLRSFARVGKWAATSPNCGETRSGTCSSMPLPKPLAAGRTRARDQDGRREARRVSVRMGRPEGGIDVGEDSIVFETRFAMVCDGLQIRE